MKILYYPGCTLKTAAKNFEASAIAAAEALDIQLVELPRWNCCGTVYSLATDDLMHQLAPIRNLIRVQEKGEDKVVTLCSMCYNTLKRANYLLAEDPEKKEKINDFMDREEDYRGEVKVLHLLEVLKERDISSAVKRPLEGLKVTPYYGCLLLRPKEIGIDDIEEPAILKDLLQSLGAEVVDTPYKTECCGSYETVNNVDLVAERAYSILRSAVRRGADAVVVSCPLCDFNLDRRQKEVSQRYSDFREIPVLYFTQLLAIALGVDGENCRFDLHYVDPRPLFKGKDLICLP